MSDKATVGVVVPGYGHPRFLAEALQSVCDQVCDFDYKVVVVDDGCRFVETADVVANFVEAYPGKVHYLRHPNSKLPGARNAGIRFLLNLMPALEAIYFLDADNRLEPYSLQAYRSVLGDDPAIGWAYPDISFFGQVRTAVGFDTRETAPEYRKLLHLIGNVSEAGSMVRADAFRDGVMYDESMKSGFEDWEFWLSMLDAGYLGRPVHHAGFSYRVRPESMLAGSRRLEESLIAYIRQKHKDLYAPRHLMQLEQESAPAFALLLPDTQRVFYFTDPTLKGEAVSLSEFQGKVSKWYSAQKEFFFPMKLLVMSSDQWKSLESNKNYLRWLFWKLRSSGAGIKRIEFTTGDMVTCVGRPWGTPNLADAIFCVSTSALRGVLDERDKIANISELPPAGKLHVITPEPLLAGSAESDVDQSLSALVSLAKAGDKPGTVRHMHRRYAGPNHKHVRRDLIDPICAFEDLVPVPVGHSRPRVTVILEGAVANSSRSQNRLNNLFSSLHQMGAEVCLVQEYSTGFDDAWRSSAEWTKFITDVFPLRQRANQEEFKMYLGRRISARLALSSKADISTIARLSDVVINVGAAGSLEVLGEIKAFGPKTLVWLEPEFEGFEKGESLAKMLAYEHAIDFLMTNDLSVQSRLSAQGVPPGKIFTTQEILQHTLGGLLSSAMDMNGNAVVEIAR